MNVQNTYRLQAHFRANDLAVLQWWSQFSRRISGPSHEFCSQSVVTDDWLGSFQVICLSVWFIYSHELDHIIATTSFMSRDIDNLQATKLRVFTLVVFSAGGRNQKQIEPF